MRERFKILTGNSGDLEEKIFNLILDMGFIVVLLSAVVTCFENLSIFAALTSVVGALLFLITLLVNYYLRKRQLARLMLCYLANCFMLPVVFFTCGGINSGMPLYMIGGLFIIVPTLKGRSRIICMGISTLVHVATIIVSYFYMEGNILGYDPAFNPLAKLSLESRILDMVVSVVLVSIFICITSGLILSAYQRERAGKEKLVARLDDLSKKDELTGLYNRRELFWHMETMSRFWQKHYYVALFDIDLFKSINDNYGHLFGDKALAIIASELWKLCDGEQDEIAARYGGEEFVVLVKGEDDEKAFAKIDGVRKKVEELVWEGHEGLKITISAGMVYCEGYENIEQVLMDADKCLYQAKKEGRNRVIFGGTKDGE
ncbi:MAG: GGDEF domain-containing protein [Lachnospiraceae bacterium]|nr:GGDEF domain-containing protein [Lachnospiraceae bacterium]